MAYVTGTATSPNASSPYYIHLQTYNGAEFPLLVLVKIKFQSTTNRPPAPNPSNGFQCEGSPFDKGHICALELGGPDISQNIVPQWSQWQETGKWRRLESTEIPAVAHDGDLFLCKVEWPGDLKAASPSLVNKDFYRDFQAESLINWDDCRIPHTFGIWVIKQSSKSFASLAAGLGTNDMKSAIDAFLSAGSSPQFTITQGAMPEEDHRHLEQRQVVNAFGEYLDAMNLYHDGRIETAAKQHAVSGKITRRQAKVNAIKELGEYRRGDVIKRFDNQHAQVFQQYLVDYCNFEQGEAANFTPARVIAANSSQYGFAPAKRIRTASEASDYRRNKLQKRANRKGIDEISEEAKKLSLPLF